MKRLQNEDNNDLLMMTAAVRIKQFIRTAAVFFFTTNSNVYLGKRL